LRDSVWTGQLGDLKMHLESRAIAGALAASSGFLLTRSCL
jgi:hypothetical protein